MLGLLRERTEKNIVRDVAADEERVEKKILWVSRENKERH